MKKPTTALQDRFESLRARLLAAVAKRDAFEVDLHVKYGPGVQRGWLSSTTRTRREKLGAAVDRIAMKIWAIVLEVSPRGDRWLTGAPSWWVASELTWEDAIRPSDEPLSVVVPAPYGQAQGLR